MQAWWRGCCRSRRAVGALQTWCWQGDGFGVENGWEACVSMPLGSSEDAKEERTGWLGAVVSDRNGEIKIMDVKSQYWIVEGMCG